MQILAVGAAARRLRLPAAEVGAAWGASAARGRPPSAPPTRTSSPSRPRPPAGRSRPPASSTTSSTACGGARPARPSPRARATPSSPPALGLSLALRRARSARARRTRAWRRCSARPTPSAPGRRRVALVVASDALVPGPGTAFEARAGAGAAAVVLVSDGGNAALAARVTRTHPFLDRYRGDGETTTRDLYDAAAVPRGDLPPDRARGRRAARRRSRCARGRSPTPTAASAPRSRKQLGAGDARVGAGVRRSSATPARPRRCSAASARSTPPAPSRSSASAAAAPPASSITADGAGAAARPRVADASAGGRPASYAEVLRARGQLVADGRDRPDGRAARERAVRARRRRDARAPRRPLRRLRHDQHPAVDPPALHQLRQHEVRAGAAGAPRRRAHVRRQPHDAGAVRRAAPPRGHRPRRRRPRDAAGRRRRRRRSRSAPRSSSCCGATRSSGASRSTASRRGRAAPTATDEQRRTHELEPGRRRRRRAHQVRRAVRAELRADGGGRVRAPRSTASTRASSPTQVDAAFVATQRGTLWGQEGIGGNTVPTAIGLAGIPCTRIENACPSGSDAFRVGAMAVASGVHDVVLVIGVEKMRDKSAEEGLLVPGGRRPPDLHPGRDRAGAVRAVRHPPHARVRHDARDARVGRGEEPLQRRPRPVRPLPERDHDRGRARVAAGVPSAPPARLLPADRRRRRDAARERRAGRASSPTSPVYVAGFGVATDHPYLHEKPTLHRRSRPRTHGRRARLRDGRRRPDADRLRRGARLLHDHRDPRHRGPRLLREGQGRRRVARGRDRRSPAASRSTRRAACSPRATRSAPPASPSSPSAGGSCGARPASARSRCATGTRSSTTSAAAARASRSSTSSRRTG